MLYAIPPLLLLLIANLIAVGFGIGGQVYVHRHFKAADFYVALASADSSYSTGQVYGASCGSGNP